MVETELFAQTYRSYGLATVRYPVLEITAKSKRLRTDVAIHCGLCGRACEEISAALFAGFFRPESQNRAN
jgi:hypothetical protein